MLMNYLLDEYLFAELSPLFRELLRLFKHCTFILKGLRKQCTLIFCPLVTKIMHSCFYIEQTI